MAASEKLECKNVKKDKETQELSPFGKFETEVLTFATANGEKNFFS